MTIEHNFALLPMYRPSASSGNARAPSAPELPDTYALEAMVGRMSIPGRRPPASVPVQAPRAPAPADFRMDNCDALVSLSGKWSYPLREQQAVIEMGQNANLDTSVTHRFGPVGVYEYVMPAFARKTYIRNVNTGQCREVMIVRKPPQPWSE